MILEWVVVALPPTTILTALAFWFGYALTNSKNAYYGVDVSTLGFSTVDYLMRSVDAVIVPAIILLVTSLILLGIHFKIWPLMLAHKRSPLTHILLIILTLAGLVAVALGTIGAITPTFQEAYLASPVLLGTGSMCALYGISGLSANRYGSNWATKDSLPPLNMRLARIVFIALFVVSLFWGASSYAGALGRGRAMKVEDNLTHRPAAIIYSKASLDLPAPVIEDRIGGADSQYRFRYTNLRLLIRSNDRYFLFPEGWTHGQDTVLLIEDNSDIRMEFRSGGPQQ